MSLLLSKSQQPYTMTTALKVRLAEVSNQPSWCLALYLGLARS